MWSLPSGSSVGEPERYQITIRLDTMAVDYFKKMVAESGVPSELN